MRIDFTTAETAFEPGASPSGQAARAASAENLGSSAVPEDTAEFSSGVSRVTGEDGPTAAQWSAQAMAPDGERSARVQALQSAVAGGSYALDPKAIADAMTG